MIAVDIEVHAPLGGRAHQGPTARLRVAQPTWRQVEFRTNAPEIAKVDVAADLHAVSQPVAAEVPVSVQFHACRIALEEAGNGLAVNEPAVCLDPVRPPQLSGIVDIQPRRLSFESESPQPVFGARAFEAQLDRVAGQRRGHRIHLDIRGVRTLEEMRAELLQVGNPFPGTLDIAAGHLAIELVRPALQPEPGIGASRVSLPVVIRGEQIEAADVPSHCSPGDPHGGARGAELLLEAHDSPPGGWHDTHLVLDSGGFVVYRGAFLRGQRDEGPDRQPPWRAAGELSRPQNRAVRRHIHVVRIRIAGGGGADAPRVEQALGLQQLPALDEERATFGKKDREGGQVYYRRVRLDLPEVGIERRVNRQARSETEFDVCADSRVDFRLTAERIVRVHETRARVIGGCRNIRDDLDRPA